ncbi:MAG TPA: alpha/beta fold hydrolase [Longimicrobium sp.]|nr:alpha/beta fold hydrolase [Longimicrobium sp.]
MVEEREKAGEGGAGEARRPRFQPRPFHPAAWLPGPHAQTVAGKYLRPRTGIVYRRERFDTPDGDFLDVDFASVEGKPGLPADAPVVLVAHGLEGSAHSGYVLESCLAAYEVGMRAVAMNFRSCGGEMNRLPRFYHAGETGDLAFVLDLLADRFPGAPLAAMGFSLGANQLLKYLGERGAEARVRAAAAVSVPFDLDLGARKLDASFMGRVYTGVFVRSLQRKFRQKREMIGDACDGRRVLAARSFREFDDAATARLHGFRDVDDYYGTQSSKNFLGAIRVPTLLVQAEDDPFVDETALPRGIERTNPWIETAFTAHGGHVGFIAGPPWKPWFWAEREAVRFLAERLRGG